MIGHRKTRLLLYDYLRGPADSAGAANSAGALGLDDSRAVAEHLARCAGCSAEAESLRAFLKVAPDGSKKPSALLDDAWWSRFSDEVAERIVETPTQAPGLLGRFLGVLGFRGFSRTTEGISAGLPSFTRALAPAFAALAVAVVVYLFVLPGGTGRDVAEPMANDPELTTETLTDVAADSVTAFDQRLSNYFERSKALLVGVSNIDPGEGHPIDLEAERRISRSLLRESRILRNGPVNPRSYRLLEDIDPILLGLANSDAGPEHPAVAVIRGGIENKNLLFKLRMQEVGRYATPVLQASYQQ